MKNTCWINEFSRLLKEREIVPKRNEIKDFEDFYHRGIKLDNHLYSKVPLISKEDFSNKNGNLSGHYLEINDKYIDLETKIRENNSPITIIGREINLGNIQLSLDLEIFPWKNTQLGNPKNYRVINSIYISISKEREDKIITSKIGEDFIIPSVGIIPKRTTASISEIISNEDELETVKNLIKMTPEKHLITLANTIALNLISKKQCATLP